MDQRLSLIIPDPEFARGEQLNVLFHYAMRMECCALGFLSSL